MRFSHPGSLECNICGQPFWKVYRTSKPDDVEAINGVYDLYIPPKGNLFSDPPPHKRRLLFCLELSAVTAQACEGIVDS